MEESPQLTYEQLVSDYNRQHLILYAQNARIEQLKKNLAAAESKVETLQKNMRSAKHILEDQEEVIRQLDVEVNELLSKIEGYQQPEDIKKDWAEEDDIRDFHQPSWTFMKPYAKILANINTQYPGLWYATTLGFQAERQRIRNLLEVEGRSRVEENFEEAQRNEEVSVDVNTQPPSVSEGEEQTILETQTPPN